MLEMGGIRLPPSFFLSSLYAVRPLSDFSFITVMPELLPVTYPRCCSLISCPDYLAHITDKQANRFLLLQCSVFFHSICVYMHGCLCVHASEVMMVTLPWLCLWHSCVQRCPHRCPGSHSAFNTCKENKTLTCTFSLFCSFSIEHVRDGVTDPRGRSVAKEEHSSQGVCASVFACGTFVYP